jgi:hypothetical protein
MAKSEKQTITAEDVQTIGADGEINNSGNSTPDSEYGIPEGFTDQQTGYPPYWNPSDGKVFLGTVLFRDARDEEFIRYVLRASRKMTCFEGEADNAQEVQVLPGQYFSVGEYAALPLEKYVGHEVMVIASGKRDIKGGKELWKFRLLCNDETTKLIAAKEQKMLDEANARFAPKTAEAEA